MSETGAKSIAAVGVSPRRKSAELLHIFGGAGREKEGTDSYTFLNITRSMDSNKQDAVGSARFQENRHLYLYFISYL